MKIGFIGLGHMGNPMAKNLLASGYDVKVYDALYAATEKLMAEGAEAAESIIELARECDVVITMLQTGEQVKEICLSQNGLFTNANQNLLYIDSSSIQIDTTKELHHLAKKHNIAMLDAPVSGGVIAAQSAKLTFMVGGDEKDFERAKSIFEKMGKKIVHAGPGGSGQAAKICNNLILGISMIAVSEGFALAEKLSLDPVKFFEISSNASGQCWSMTSYCPFPGVVENTPANNSYKPGFAVKMMVKDLHLAENAAKAAGAHIPLGQEALEIYNQFLEDGNADLDFSGIIRLFRGKKIKSSAHE